MGLAVYTCHLWCSLWSELYLICIYGCHLTMIDPWASFRMDLTVSVCLSFAFMVIDSAHSRVGWSKEARIVPPLGPFLLCAMKAWACRLISYLACAFKVHKGFGPHLGSSLFHKCLVLCYWMTLDPGVTARLILHSMACELMYLWNDWDDLDVGLPFDDTLWSAAVLNGIICDSYDKSCHSMWTEEVRWDSVLPDRILVTGFSYRVARNTLTNSTWAQAWTPA